jgi:hypothetical protein
MPLFKKILRILGLLYPNQPKGLLLGELEGRTCLTDCLDSRIVQLSVSSLLCRGHGSAVGLFWLKARTPHAARFV